MRGGITHFCRDLHQRVVIFFSPFWETEIIICLRIETLEMCCTKKLQSLVISCVRDVCVYIKDIQLLFYLIIILHISSSLRETTWAHPLCKYVFLFSVSGQLFHTVKDLFFKLC